MGSPYPMPNFFTKTTLLNVLMGFSTFFSVLSVLWTLAQWLLANSHYLWITDCEPTCGAWAPLGNFRPAIGTPHALLDPQLQETMLLFQSFVHWFVVADVGRALYPFVYAVATGYIREYIAMIVAAVFMGVFLLWEVARLVFYIVAVITPEDWPIVFGPGGLSSTPSTQFWILLGGAIGEVVYLLYMLAACIGMAVLAQQAKADERDAGSVPMAGIGTDITMAKSTKRKVY